LLEKNKEVINIKKKNTRDTGKKNTWIKRIRREIAKEMMPDQERREKAGREAELKVKEVLQEMRNKRKIKGYIWHRKWSRKDCQGIDFTILPGKGPPIYLQVKSSIFPSTVEHFQLTEIRPGIWKKQRNGYELYYIQAGTEIQKSQVRRVIQKILEIEEKKERVSAHFFILYVLSSQFGKEIDPPPPFSSSSLIR